MTASHDETETRRNGHHDDDARASVLADKQVFTTGEAAELCKVSQQTIIRCFDAGRLHGFRVPGSRFRRIPRDELVKFMKGNGIPTDALSTGRKRVLVVDDDEAIVELVSDVLGTDPRLEIKSAGTGYDAGLLTHSFKPNLMVLDYMLPDLNGNHVCRSVRDQPDLGDIRIIAVSGVVGESEVQSLLDAGADAFIKKPFDIKLLRDKVLQLLELV